MMIRILLILMEAIPLCDMIQIYTSVYVNTQLYLLLMQLYFALGDMFRLLKQPSSGQILLMPDTLLSLKLLAKRSASIFSPCEFRCRPWVRHVQEENMSKNGGLLD